MVQLDRVQKRYGSRVLFEGLSWTIPQGARLGLVGPNGAGKTTLLRLLAGEEAPDEGECRVPSAIRVGYLPQEVESLTEGSVLSSVLDGFPELRALEEELADPTAWASPSATERNTTRHEEAKRRVEELMARWETAAG